MCPCEEHGGTCECDTIEQEIQSTLACPYDSQSQTENCLCETGRTSDITPSDLIDIIQKKDEQIENIKNAMAALILVDKRNIEMDKSMVEKQQMARNEINALKMELDEERGRCEQLRQAFEISQQQQNELIHKVREQCKVTCQLQYERDMLKRNMMCLEDKLLQATTIMNEEKERNRLIEMKLIKEQNSNRNLKVLLHTEIDNRKREMKEAENLRKQMERLMSSEVMSRRQPGQQSYEHCNCVNYPMISNGRIRGGTSNLREIVKQIEDCSTFKTFALATKSEEGSAVMEWSSKTSLTMWM